MGFQPNETEHGHTNKFHELSLVKNNDKLDQYRSVGIIVSDDALTFTMVPKKGFFGIGKSKAECFTCPKKIYSQVKQEFDLSKKNLQQSATLIIGNDEYPFLVRLVNMNRTKVRKLLPSKLIKREVIQFSWKSNPQTQSKIKEYLAESYSKLLLGDETTVDPVEFRYCGDRKFQICRHGSSIKDEHVFEIGVEYRDMGRPTSTEDQFMGWINLEGSGIRNAGGIRGLKSLRTGHSGLDALILVTSHKSGNLHNPWDDKIDSRDSSMFYWGDAKQHSEKSIMDFQGNRYLREAEESQIPILHFVRNRQSYVEFSGIYVMQKLETKQMTDQGMTIDNLFVTLERTQDKTVNCNWLTDWRTKDGWTERTKNGPSDWLSRVKPQKTTTHTSSSDSITANIPSSFVQRKIKLANDRGNGEAKLYIGPVKNKEGYERFFCNWHPMNTYELDQVELLLYLQDVELEFSKQSKYKAVSKKLHRELFNKVERLEDNRIDLTYHEDKSRYYIRGTSEAWKLIRQTCLPLISTLLIEVKSSNDDGSCDYVVRILRSDEERAANPTSGMKSKSRKKKPQRKAKQTRVKPIPEDSRTISDDLKDRVWRRDQGMCQANYKLDSRLDKNTGEVCGSNENLEFDHIVPFSRGGKTTYRNLQLLCRTHNRIKSDREI